MVQIIRKASLPTPDKVAARTRAAAEQARAVTAKRGPGTLEQLFHQGDVWTVHEDGTIS